MAMSENSRKVIEYLRTVNGKDVTAADVAETLGLGKQSINGIFTSAIQRKGFGFREEAEIENIKNSATEDEQNNIGGKGSKEGSNIYRCRMQRIPFDGRGAYRHQKREGSCRDFQKHSTGAYAWHTGNRGTGGE